MSRTVERFNDFNHVNRITSSNSVHVYRDELFGPAFANSWFVSEPVHNLIHRQVLTPDGVTFKSERAPGEEKAEFLASTDNWFRPTMIQTGPDGCLWIADMYRAVIEHPQWIPPDWQPWAVALLASLAVAIGIPAATRASRASGSKDPQWIVIDEVAGQLITLIAVPISWKSLLLGFILFRGFDIVKPPPLRRLEQLPEGAGIVADDVGAGLYALAVMQIVLHFGLLPR